MTKQVWLNPSVPKIWDRGRGAQAIRQGHI